MGKNEPANSTALSNERHAKGMRSCNQYTPMPVLPPPFLFFSEPFENKKKFIDKDRLASLSHSPVPRFDEATVSMPALFAPSPAECRAGVSGPELGFSSVQGK
jgi:hypothetical protein